MLFHTYWKCDNQVKDSLKNHRQITAQLNEVDETDTSVVVEHPTRSDCTYQSLLAFIRSAIIVYFAFCCVEIYGVYFCPCVCVWGRRREQIE